LWGVRGVALSVMLPLRVPPAAGLKVALIVQFAPRPRCLAQLLVWENAPFIAKAEIVSATLPVFVRVTLWALLFAPP